MKKYLGSAAFLVGLCLGQSSYAQVEKPKESTGLKLDLAKKWFERISLRGYAQVRYNRLFETNAKLKCEQCQM